MRKGEIFKSENPQVNTREMELINKYTRRPFKEDEVYTFSVVLCDNDVDRDFERFTVEALFEMEKLFAGKTGICDHNPKANNQRARIYTCAVEAVEGRKTANGDDYFRLTAKAYMPRIPENEAMITQIESGILKEVSVGLCAEKSVCSVCGADKQKNACGHTAGKTYGTQTCYFELSGISDVYEWSFVAVPAQREAGVIKGYFPDLRKEGSSVNTILKSLQTGDSVTLCVEDSKRLYEYILKLEKEAKDATDYREDIRAQVLKLSAVAVPGVSSETMEASLKGLSVSQLREFMEEYSGACKKKLLCTPATASKKTAVATDGNKEFRI